MLDIVDINGVFCPNADCPDFGLRDGDNVSVLRRYGGSTGKERILMYCRTCGERFSERRGSVFFGCHLSDDTIADVIRHVSEGESIRSTAKKLGLNKDTVSRVLARAHEHSSLMLSNLMTSLMLPDRDFGLLVSFIQRRKPAFYLRPNAHDGGGAKTARLRETSSGVEQQAKHPQ